MRGGCIPRGLPCCYWCQTVSWRLLFRVYLNTEHPLLDDRHFLLHGSCHRKGHAPGWLWLAGMSIALRSVYG